MSAQIKRSTIYLAGLILVCTIGVVPSSAENLLHALTGVISKVDSTSKTLTVKAADGTEHAFTYTKKTAVRDSQAAEREVNQATVDSYLAGKQGSQVVVAYTEKGANQVATSVKDYGKQSFKVADGVVESADQTTHTLTVKTADGATRSFDVAKDAVVETNHGAVDAAKWSYHQGDQIRVHYVNTAGKDIAHFIQKL